jgi:small subunit ribosomal protein S18
VNQTEDEAPEEAEESLPEQPETAEESAPERPEGVAPRTERRRPRYTSRRKVCFFCVEKVTTIDYKDVDALRRYLSDRGKIEPRRKTGTCAKHQRRLTIALKRARHLALLPYTADHLRPSGPPPPRA